MPRQAIQSRVQALQIPYLVHFTRVANLPSILRHGIYPVSRAPEVGVEPEINDQLRLDGHLDGISTSIAFPNYRMFYRYRQENPLVEWVVLGINASVLWEKNCGFCCHNAADARISRQPLVSLQTLEALDGMFLEIEGIQSRHDQRLRPYDPTDGQAEVLVFDLIEPAQIFGVIFGSDQVREACRQMCGQRELLVNNPGRGLFAARSFER